MKINQPPPPLIKHEDIITLENNQIQISPEFHQFYINLLIIIKILILMKITTIGKFNDLQQLQNYVEN